MLAVRCLDSNEWRLAQGKGPFIRRGRDSGYVWNAGCRKYLSGSVRDCPKIWVGMRDWRTLLGSRKTSTNLLINFLNKTDDRPKFKKGLLVKEINALFESTGQKGDFICYICLNGANSIRVYSRREVNLISAASIHWSSESYWLIVKTDLRKPEKKSRL